MGQKRELTFLFRFVAIVFFTILFMGQSAYAKEKVWKMTSVWTPGLVNLYESNKIFAETVNLLCKGKLNIKLFAGGTIMPASEVFDACRNNVVQCAGDWAGYWGGKDIIFTLLGSYPMGLSQWDYLLWYYNGGGDAIMDEAYGKYGLIYFPNIFSPAESGIRSNVPINSAADFKGKKIRMSGKAQGYVLNKLGAAHVQLSGSEVYQALQKGTVDGAEFASPLIDAQVGLADISKYWLVPGWHQPGGASGIMINKKAWEELDAETKEKVKIAAQVSLLKSSAALSYEAIEGTKKFLEKGVEVITYDEKTLDLIEKHINDYTEEAAMKDPLFKKAVQSQIKYRKDFAAWRNIEGKFGFGYTPKTYPNLDK